jgi:uncharacterized protein YndB with AHSA1/START domain
MARETMFINAPPEAVFEVLADPRTFADWVVGSHRIRAADDSWPAAGAGFDHHLGVPPLLIADETVVLASDPPHCLELHAKARPLPTARVRLELASEDGGTRVTMIENFANPWLNVLAGPFGHGLMRVRNRECLRRLRKLAEDPHPRRGGNRDRLPARSTVSR